MNPSIKQVLTAIVDATASGTMPCKVAVTMGYWDEPLDDIIQGTATLGYLSRICEVSVTLRWPETTGMNDVVHTRLLAQKRILLKDIAGESNDGTRVHAKYMI
jgi:hypothetical protein